MAGGGGEEEISPRSDQRNIKGKTNADPHKKDEGNDLDITQTLCLIIITESGSFDLISEKLLQSVYVFVNVPTSKQNFSNRGFKHLNRPK